MTHALKPKMMCLIKGYLNYPGNLGRGCELVQLLEPGAMCTHPLDQGISIELMEDRAAWVVTGRALTYGQERGWTLVLPEHLLPIDQLPLHELRMLESLA